MTDQEKLAKVEARIAKLNGIIHAPDPVSQAFPLGRVGGSGPNVAALNRRREATVEKTIDAAVEWKKLTEEAARLRARIREASPEYQDDKAARAKRAEEAFARLEAYIRTLPPGSPIESQFGTGTIRRHNKKGATVEFAMFKESIRYRDLWLSKDQLAGFRAASLAEA